MEQLDHRQLLSVNFTGNVATDFPASMSPGVVVLPDNPNVTHPTIAPDLQNIVKVSGFDITGIRVTYTPADDVLSIGIQQPASQQTGQPGPVIAGDADNNGNDGTVSQDVLDVNPTFQDYPDFGGSEYMGIFLDLKGSGYADVVAGYAINDPRSPKQYLVADAVVDTTQPPTVLPDFGTPLPANTGNVYKVNSPAHPNLEFEINNFSKLYLQETGQALTPNSVIRMGAFAGSQEDTGIGEAYFPQQSFPLGEAIPPPVCPPVSPPIIINPHENRHINTAHPSAVRVNIIGSSGFDVTKIDPTSVRLGGATPVFGFDRFINQDEFLDATFVFKGDDIVLPPGLTDATVTGELTDGTTFSSTVKVFNRDRSFYTAAQNQGQEQRELTREARRLGFANVPTNLQAPLPAAAASSLQVSYEPAIQPSAPTVKVPGLDPSRARSLKVTGLQGQAPKVNLGQIDANAATSVKVQGPNGLGASKPIAAASRPSARILAGTRPLRSSVSDSLDAMLHEMDATDLTPTSTASGAR